MSNIKEKIVILSGAGTSAESGLSTFRDADGLWEGHEITEVASPQGFAHNPSLVLDFYNQRRRQLLTVKPNLAHQLIAQLETRFDVTVVTQNVDDLHERAGSSQVVHLHGELLKSQSTADASLVYDCQQDILLGDLCEIGSQLRPFIVWFGEQVPMLEQAALAVAQADKIIIVGTSMQVYPAASLVEFAQSHACVFYIDPKPAINYALEQSRQLEVIEETATVGLSQLFKKLITG